MEIAVADLVSLQTTVADSPQPSRHHTGSSTRVTPVVLFKTLMQHTTTATHNTQHSQSKGNRPP